LKFNNINGLRKIEGASENFKTIIGSVPKKRPHKSGATVPLNDGFHSLLYGTNVGVGEEQERGGAGRQGEDAVSRVQLYRYRIVCRSVCFQLFGYILKF